MWESSVEILLAVNRCVEFGIPQIKEFLFDGWRTWLWMIPPAIYAFYMFFFEKPILFTSIYFGWFFDPHIGYFPPSQASTDVSIKTNYF